MVSGYVALLESYEVSLGDQPVFSVDCRGILDSGITVSSVSIADADGLTISGEAVSAAELVIKRRTVPTAHAVQFQVTAGLAAGTSYEPVITLTLSNGDVRSYSVPFSVVA